MVRRFLFVNLALGVLLLPTIASANSLVFTFGNPLNTPGVGLVRFTTGNAVGMLSNQHPSLTQKVSPAILTGVANVGPGGSSISGLNLGSVTFSTGMQMGSPISTLNGSLYTYAGGTGTSLSIMSSDPNLTGVVGPVALFSGFFSSQATFLVTTPVPGKPKIKIGNLTAKVTTNSLSPYLLNLLGLPYQNHGTAVALYIDVVVGKGGGITSGTITLVPEPGTLVLFGSGLVTLAGLLRKRLK